MPKIEVLGTDDSSATRAALRFFRERRIVPRYVDVGAKTPAREELRQLVDRLGAEVVIDTTSRAWRDLGPDERPATPGTVVEWLRADVRRLRLPIVRHEGQVTAGPAEATWRAWLGRTR
jgi:arsenate reductase-like glutaredoxin family protein